MNRDIDGDEVVTLKRASEILNMKLAMLKRLIVQKKLKARKGTNAWLWIKKKDLFSLEINKNKVASKATEMNIKMSKHAIAKDYYIVEQLSEVIGFRGRVFTEMYFNKIYDYCLANTFPPVANINEILLTAIEERPATSYKKEIIIGFAFGIEKHDVLFKNYYKHFSFYNFPQSYYSLNTKRDIHKVIVTSQGSFDALESYKKLGCDNKSVHFIIDADGTIHQTLPLNDIAVLSNLESERNAIVIEMVNPIKPFYGKLDKRYERAEIDTFMPHNKFSKRQVLGNTEEAIESLYELVSALQEIYPIGNYLPFNANDGLPYWTTNKQFSAVFSGVCSMYNITTKRMDAVPDWYNYFIEKGWEAYNV